MTRFLLFCSTCGLLLGSATPPPDLPLPRLLYDFAGCAWQGPGGCAVLAWESGLAFAQPARAPAPRQEVVATAAPTQPLAPLEPQRAPTPADAVEVAAAAPPASTATSGPKEPAADGNERQPPKAAWTKPAWRPGGVRVVISIPQQKAYVFEDGELVATSPVSTGKPGHETPVGTFRILQKKVHHRSNRYANAPMPYMQRLTSYGIALHAGKLPGYPASHGCIRLPWSFAKKLYGITDFGTKVTVTDRRPKSANEALTLV